MLYFFRAMNALQNFISLRRLKLESSKNSLALDWRRQTGKDAALLQPVGSPVLRYICFSHRTSPPLGSPTVGCCCPASLSRLSGTRYSLVKLPIRALPVSGSMLDQALLPPPA